MMCCIFRETRNIPSVQAMAVNGILTNIMSLSKNAHALDYAVVHVDLFLVVLSEADIDI